MSVSCVPCSAMWPWSRTRIRLACLIVLMRCEITIAVPKTRRKVVLNQSIEVKAAAENNLKSIDVQFPVGAFVCVTGVSGSGKSTLVNEVFLKAMMRLVHQSRVHPGQHDRVIGASRVDKVVQIDQSPINPTTEPSGGRRRSRSSAWRSPLTAVSSTAPSPSWDAESTT